MVFSGESVLPWGWKARGALADLLAYHGRIHELSHLSFSMENPLPPGKGMGSSTVDICGVLYAAARCLGIPLSVESVARHALAVEPTNGLFIPGIGMFDHRQGRCLESVGSLPGMRVAVLDAGGSVDTRAFNERADLLDLNQRKEESIIQALELALRGLGLGDTAMVGRAATLSALANQPILPKPRLPELIETALAGGAAGVSAAHSGTVIGILYDMQSEQAQSGVERLLNAFACYELLFWTQTVGGGVQWRTSPLTP